MTRPPTSAATVDAGAPARQRRRWLWLPALLLAGAVAATVWALSHDAGERRQIAARSLRALVGPPAPAPELLRIDDAPTPGAALDPVRIPAATPEPEPPPPLRPAGLEGVSFVLLLGADNRDDRVVGRTDAMIVAGFRDRDGKLAAFSIPRDLWVPLPDVGELHEQGRDHARVSSVVRVGEVRLGPGQGLPLLRRTLQDQLGIRIDRYARVDFAGFVGLIDRLGGVDVDVECPIMDCFWLNGTDQPCVMTSVPAGRVHMDGATALAFVRSRHGTGDRDRTRRQQAVILGLAREARQKGLRGLPGLWRQAEPYVDSDLAADDAVYYGSFALEIELAGIRGFSVGGEMIRKHVTTDGKHVLLLDRPAFDQALAGMFDGELPVLRGRKHCPDPDAALK